jgi:carboxypeptidase PM20D1
MTGSATFEPGATLPGVSEREPAQRLARAVQFQTISYEDPAQFDDEAFTGLHHYLEAAFPRVHAALTRETIGRYSLLYTWPGQDLALAPVVLAGHLDVVPVEAASESDWTFPPFDGRIDGGFVWGRGSLDDKAAVLGILEAAEALLSVGFCPHRSVLFAFGEDEEVGGLNGAAQLAALLRAQGIQPQYVLDEGLAITDGIVPNVSRPVAMIGIAEKGYLSLELSVEVGGGHSSMPPRETAIGILSAAVVRLEGHPMPARLAGPAAQMMARLAGEMPRAIRLVMANQRLFGPLIVRIMARSPSTAASIQTTTAPTIFQAGVKENVLCSRARAVVNFRLLPGDTIAGVTGRVRKTIADPRVTVAETGVMRSEPSPVSDTASPGFRAIEQAIARVFPGVAVAPGLVLGGTDSRHYAPLGCPCYRFMPLWVRPEDLGRMHGVNERIAVDHYARAVEFYTELIRASE